MMAAAAVAEPVSDAASPIEIEAQPRAMMLADAEGVETTATKRWRTKRPLRLEAKMRRCLKPKDWSPRVRKWMLLKLKPMRPR